jgi:rhodanese-related sulfurtransferase
MFFDRLQTASPRLVAISLASLLGACRDPAPPHAASGSRMRDGGADVHRVRTLTFDAGLLPDGAPARNPNLPTVTRAQAHELVAHGAHLVDVRSDAEYAAGHLPGAIHLPVELAWRRHTEIPPGEIVVYANGLPDNRSARARRILTAFGGRTVYDLGAMSNW